LIRYFLSAESFSGNWMSKVMIRFPLWEGSCDSGIPSPVTTFLYAGLMRYKKQIRDRKRLIDADDAQTQNILFSF